MFFWVISLSFYEFMKPRFFSQESPSCCPPSSYSYEYTYASICICVEHLLNIITIVIIVTGTGLVNLYIQLHYIINHCNPIMSSSRCFVTGAPCLEPYSVSVKIEKIQMDDHAYQLTYVDLSWEALYRSCICTHIRLSTPFVAYTCKMQKM